MAFISFASAGSEGAGPQGESNVRSVALTRGGWWRGRSSGRIRRCSRARSDLGTLFRRPRAVHALVHALVHAMHREKRAVTAAVSGGEEAAQDDEAGQREGPEA